MNYNRRTPAKDQANLSSESKLEGILKFGDFDELILCIKTNPDLAYKVFIKRTQKDLLISDKRKNFLSHLFQLLPA